MPYTKYIHIKESTKNNKKTMEGVDGYIDDDEKTAEKTSSKSNVPSADDEGKVESMDGINDYIENDMKTINPKNMQHLVGVINCDSPDDFVATCDESKKYYRARKTEHLKDGQTANEGYHIIFSCKGKDMDPELVFHAGLDVARELAGSDFAAKVCTHLNTDNWHSHIAICAYSLPGLYPHKFKDEWRMIEKIRRISDEVSLRYGFELIVPGLTDKKNWAEYIEGKADWDEVKSAMTEVKRDIRNAADAAENMDHYKQLMQSAGYDLIEKNNRITYIKEGTVVSDYRLGTRYSAEGISDQIARRKDKETKQLITREVLKASPKINKTPSLSGIYIPKYTDKGMRIPAIIRLLLYIKKCVERFGNMFFDPSMEQAFPDNLRTQSPAKKIKAIDKAIEICQKYNIQTLAGLKSAMRDAGATAKSNDYEAERYFAIAGAMEDAVSVLKIESDLKTIMTSLGIEDEDFAIRSVPEQEVKYNLASLDPMTGKLKKQLYNALNGSGYRLAGNGFSDLSRSDAEQILDFLNHKTGKKPDTLLSPEESQKAKAEYNLENIAERTIKNLEDKYESFPASEAQMKLLDRTLPEDLKDKIKNDGLSRSDAIRLTRKYSYNLSEEILQSGSRAGEAATSWQKLVLKDLQRVKPDEFGRLNAEAINQKDAHAVINYALAQYDNIDNEIVKRQSTADKKANDTSSGIRYDTRTEEEKLCIVEYKHLLDVKAKYGLDTSEKVQAFIGQYDDVLSRAGDAVERSREASDAYWDLNYLSRTMKNITSKTFAFGQRFGGSDEQLQDEIAKMSDDKLDRLHELQNKIGNALTELSGHQLYDADIRSLNFEPVSPEYRDVLKTLKQYFPAYFSTITKPITQATETDAYEIFSRIQSEKVIEKAVQTMKDKEKSDEIRQDRERQNNRGR